LIFGDPSGFASFVVCIALDAAPQVTRPTA
jgi:hypothetical protein